jgi:hypothetical protein
MDLPISWKRRPSLDVVVISWTTGCCALADASEITGLPRDYFEVHEISKAEFEGCIVNRSTLPDSDIVRRSRIRTLLFGQVR